MIPQKRLVAWSAIVLVPFAIIAHWNAAAMAVSLTAILFFVFVVLADAVASRGRLAGITVDLPAIVRLQRERPGAIEILIHQRIQTRPHPPHRAGIPAGDPFPGMTIFPSRWPRTRRPRASNGRASRKKEGAT